MFAFLAQRAVPTVMFEAEAGAEAAATISDFAVAFGTLPIKFIAILLVADIILGIAAAIASKEFNFNKLAAFMSKGVVPYLFGFAVVEVVAFGFGTYGQMVATVIFVAIVLNLLGSIISNLATLGVNMPSIFKKTT